jgi:hypothetical protein
MNTADTMDMGISLATDWSSSREELVAETAYCMKKSYSLCYGKESTREDLPQPKRKVVE